MLDETKLGYSEFLKDDWAACGKNKRVGELGSHYLHWLNLGLFTIIQVLGMFVSMLCK